MILFLFAFIFFGRRTLCRAMCGGNKRLPGLLSGYKRLPPEFIGKRALRPSAGSTFRHCWYYAAGVCSLLHSSSDTFTQRKAGAGRAKVCRDWRSFGRRLGTESVAPLPLSPRARVCVCVCVAALYIFPVENFVDSHPVLSCGFKKFSNQSRTRRQSRTKGSGRGGGDSGRNIMFEFGE